MLSKIVAYYCVLVAVTQVTDAVSVRPFRHGTARLQIANLKHILVSMSTRVQYSVIYLLCFLGYTLH